MERIIEKHKLFDDTYLFVFESCLAICKVNENNEFVRLSIFGHSELDRADLLEWPNQSL